MDLWERRELWALAGVAVGFLLTVAWEIVRDRLSTRKKRKAIEGELRTNLGLIPQKIDHLRSVKRALDRGAVVPGHNVHCATYLYDLYIGEVGLRLKEPQRENLHVVYASMRVVDRFLDDLFRDFIEFSATGQLREPFRAYAGMCEELIGTCELVREMIGEYLEGRPRKVTWEEPQQA